jgi:hypothetical protein
VAAMAMLVAAELAACVAPLEQLAVVDLLNLH